MTVERSTGPSPSPARSLTTRRSWTHGVAGLFHLSGMSERSKVRVPVGVPFDGVLGILQVGGATVHLVNVERRFVAVSDLAADVRARLEAMGAMVVPDRSHGTDLPAHMAGWAAVLDNAARVRARLVELGQDDLHVVETGEGGLAFVWEATGLYADIECAPEGDVLLGLMDWIAPASSKNPVVAEVDPADRETFRPTWERLSAFMGWTTWAAGAER